jgi:hypothetical protein
LADALAITAAAHGREVAEEHRVALAAWIRASASAIESDTAQEADPGRAHRLVEEAERVRT